MNPIYSQISLDLQHKSIEPVNLKQYDYEARSILFHITDNGSPYLLTDDMLAEVKIHKPDGTKVVARGNIHVGSNELTVKVSRQMTAVYGVLCADITLFREDRLLSTMPFHLHVEKSPIQNEDIDSADEYTLLEDLIAYTQKNEALRQANEQTRVQEEQARVQNEQTRAQEEQARVQNEQTRAQEEHTRIQNEQARMQEEQARVQNEQTRVQNEQVRKQEEQARVQEEQARAQREAEQRERIDTLLSIARTVTQETSDAAADLQRKLDSHHFVLTEDKGKSGGVAALDMAGKIPDVELYEATTSRKGVTQLIDSVTSNSTTTAATPNSVKTVYDAVVEVGSQKHTHSNKPVLDGITADAVRQWNAAANRADTWRGIQDNLTSTSAVDSLSANQGRVLKELIDSRTSTPVTVPWSRVTEKPGSYPPSAHTHDDRYYTETEVNSLLGGKANTGHTHNYLPLTGGTLTGSIGIGDSSYGTKVQIYTNKEGGNIQIISPDSYNRYWEMDAYNSVFRIYAHTVLDNQNWFPFLIDLDQVTLTNLQVNGNIRLQNGKFIKLGPDAAIYNGVVDWSSWCFDNGKGITLSSGLNSYVALRPATDNDMLLGVPNNRWLNIYAGSSTISTSDRNYKKDITPISNLYLDFFALLKPVSYRYIDGESNRIHVGFISQDVEAAMAQCGLSDLDFAGFCKDKKRRAVPCRHSRQKLDDFGSPLMDEYGNPIMEEYETITYEDDLDSDGNPIYIYSLRYEEFIALNTAVIQRQQAKIASLEERLERLEAKIL